MAKLVLGAKHGRPIMPVESKVTSHSDIDATKAAQIGFWGTKDKPKYYSLRYVPGVQVGDNANTDAVLKEIGKLISTMESALKAESVVCESSQGEKLGEYPPTEVIGPIASGRSVPAQIAQLLNEAISLWHQRSMQVENRERALADAREREILSTDGTSAPRAKRERFV